ncbi:MAG TPA: selenocysteine-specific translation elongation factor [Gemmatimonadales bacterium]|nr:selenocysteine-specific translation elongation factor [Gemmatimonadales bacterium]
MDHHVVIGTAGHVDHGKTALVKALTGTDTDRWEEEKRRGITIDLGFAAMRLAPDVTASVVDVPGHEDFVRNMVAGATGVDVALLVVAADEGVMPQTTEHLAILEFLAVSSGVVAISKADLVDQEWLDLVRTDVAERLAATSIRWEPPVAVSSVTGAGLDHLRDALTAAARRSRARMRDDVFRLPVDRVFTIAGAGTVVTGTTWSGAVSVGDEVIVLPGGSRARVRSIEVHGEARGRAEPGRRTALALAGVERDACERGSVIVSDPSWRATTAVDVIVSLLPSARPLTQRTPVRLHLGTAEVMARVTPLENEIAPGTSAPARLRLAGSIVSRWGDRGVLRSASPVTTIGGCVVVDPWPPSRPRRPVGAAQRGASDPVARVRAFVERSELIGESLKVADLPVRLGVHPGAVGQTIAAAARDGVTQVGEALVSRSAGIAGVELARRALEAYHRAHSLEPGMPLELWRKELGGGEVSRLVETQLLASGEAVVDGAYIRAEWHVPAVPPSLAATATKVMEELSKAGKEGRTPAELAAVAPADAHSLLEFFVRDGRAARVGRDRYYVRAELERIRDSILAEIKRLGQASPADLRQVTGLSRKYLIPLLEWMDGAGFTVRVGDARRLGPAAHH